MTINEAVQRLEKLPLPLKSKEDYENHVAVRIGIEALKDIGRKRRAGTISGAYLLPGETR